MTREREKRATLEPLHGIAKTLLPKLGISQQNLLYYASLANFHTVHDLRNLKADQTQLYLLCYAWVRYRQLSDNLVDAMAYHMKQLEDKSSADAKQSFADEQAHRQQHTPQVGRLLSLYIDDSVPDPTPFGDVRHTGIEIEISNQCAKLIANAVIYYNSAILSRLLTKYEATGNAKALALIAQISPAAWRHILLNGHYTFQSNGKMIDLDALVARLELE